MTDFPNQTAILIFARSAIKESVSKIISPSRKQNLQFWDFCNKQIKLTAENSGIPFFISDEKTQGTGTFGQKLSRAVKSIFAKGFTNVIIVGNDCLALKSEHILQAYDSIENGIPAIGRDNHGGCYIITVSKKNFDKTVFENIPWQTSKVYESIAKNCNGNFLDLEKLNDFNDRKAFLSAWNSGTIPLEFRTLFKNMLAQNSLLFDVDYFFPNRFIITSNYNKGSPAGFFL